LRANAEILLLAILVPMLLSDQLRTQWA